MEDKYLQDPTVFSFNSHHDLCMCVDCLGQAQEEVPRS